MSATALGAITLLALTASIAFAHDPLAISNAYVPANGSLVAGELPAQIVVNFQNTFPQAGSAQNPSIPVAQVLDASGADHVARAEQNPGNAKQLLIYTKDRTTPGKYRVTWTITASDGAVVSNNGSDVAEEGAPLTFTVASANGSTQTTPNPSGGGSTSTTPAVSTSTSHAGLIAGIGIAILAVIAIGGGIFWARRRQGGDSSAPGSQ